MKILALRVQHQFGEGGGERGGGGAIREKTHKTLGGGDCTLSGRVLLFLHCSPQFFLFPCVILFICLLSSLYLPSQFFLFASLIYFFCLLSSPYLPPQFSFFFCLRNSLYLYHQFSLYASVNSWFHAVVSTSLIFCVNYLPCLFTILFYLIYGQ